MCDKCLGTVMCSCDRYYCGALLHADMEQDVHMLLEGTIAKKIETLEPAYTENSYGKRNLCYM